MVEGRPAGLDPDRDELSRLPCGGRALDGGEPVRRCVELRPVLLGSRPVMRAARVRDRSRLGRRVVERDPAGDHLGWDEVVEIRPVLVHTERLGLRRLPDAVVLQDPHAVPAHELGGKPPSPLGQHLTRDLRIRLPAVADLTRAVLRIPAGDPVHLVWPDPARVVASEQPVEALAHELDRRVVDESLFDDQEAVAVECGEVVFCPAVDHRAANSCTSSRSAGPNQGGAPATAFSRAWSGFDVAGMTTWTR